MQTGACLLEKNVSEHLPPREIPPLIARVQSGDRQAFEQLYHEHAGRVYALCLRLVADPGRAAELTQDVFVRVWQNVAGFKGESLFSSWLHRVTVNVVLMELRTEKRRTARIIATGSLEHLDAGYSPPSPGSAVDLEHAIGTLPPQARIVFVLHDVEGFTHEEIAAQMGIATGTTKAQLHRARSLLKEVLRS